MLLGAGAKKLCPSSVTMLLARFSPLIKKLMPKPQRYSSYVVRYRCRRGAPKSHRVLPTRAQMSFAGGMQAILDLDNGILRAWWIDPLVATASFGLAIHTYLRQERKLGLAYYEPFPGVMTQSLIAYWIGILIWKAFILPPAATLPDGIPNDCRSLLYLIWEVISGIVLYDFLIFFWHWATHEIPFLRSVHRRHHNSHRPGRLESRDVLRHSLVDGTVQVLINIFVQRRILLWGPVKSRLARAVHNVLVTWMLTESHTASPEPRVFRRFGWLFRESEIIEGIIFIIIETATQ